MRLSSLTRRFPEMAANNYYETRNVDMVPGGEVDREDKHHHARKGQKEKMKDKERKQTFLRWPHAGEHERERDEGGHGPFAPALDVHEDMSAITVDVDLAVREQFQNNLLNMSDI
jgi:hypothetical protein